MKERILAILTDTPDKAVSGAEIARRLGVSRAAVWKAINALRDEGYEITAATNRGYALSPSDALTAAGVRARLNTRILGSEITVLPRAESTNTLLKEQARTGAPEGCVLIAREQTAGRGRLGRGFFSPPGSGLYMSVLLRPRMPAAEAGTLTMMAAVAVTRAVTARYGVSPQIKWVNDIFLNGKKICGILSEAALELETGFMEYAVVGIGINLTTPETAFPPELREIAGSICPGATAETEAMAAAILTELEDLYLQLPSRAFMDDYRRHSMVLGREVTFQREGKDYRMTVRQIEDDGTLVLEKDGETLRLFSGEVGIRPAK